MTSDAVSRPRARSLLQHLPGPLVRQWESGPGGLLLQLFEHRTTEVPLTVPTVAEPLLVWIASGAARLEERDDETDWRAIETQAGDLFLVDSDEPYELRWNAGDRPFQALHVHIGVPLIREAARTVLGQLQRPAFREASGVRDDAISALLNVVHCEMMRIGQPAPMLLEGIGRALAVCLVRTFADPSSRLRRRSALPAYKLRAVIRHMREHAAEPFSLAALADVAGMSRFHFSRMFHRATGHSPQRYFIDLRIAEAQRLLQETDRPIIEIGLALGYTSPSHFAQAFRRVTGMSPSVFRH